MTPANLTLKIISQRPGEQTGETCYQTEDGTWWESAQYKEPCGTGTRYGVKTDGYIKRELP